MRWGYSVGCRVALLLACALAWAPPLPAQIPVPDGISSLLQRLETILRQGSADDLTGVIDPAVPPDDLAQLTANFSTAHVRNAVVSERDRSALADAPSGNGYRIVAELFTETQARARIVTVVFDARRPADGADWRITAVHALTAIEGLFRLTIDPAKQFAAQNLTVTAEDFQLTLINGSVFLVESDPGVTGLILLGHGVMRFSPQPETERGQLRIFSGASTLHAQFDTAFVRLNPADYEDRVATGALTAVSPAVRDMQRAHEVLARDAPKSFNLDLSELSPEAWYLLPPRGDFLAEVRTRRHGTITYARAAQQAEDMTVFDRSRKRTIALYPSAARRALGGTSFNEDDLREYDVLDYDIDAHVSPVDEFVDARVELRLRMRSAGISALTLRLANDLDVKSITSAEYGRLLGVRVRNQDSIIVNLPVALRKDSVLTLRIAYSGRVASQNIDDEGVQVADYPFTAKEPNFLLSSRSYWYPQNPIGDYATATMRIVVPDGYGCVASGQPRSGEVLTLRDLLTAPDSRPFLFTAGDPLRYLAVVVSRFVRVAEGTVNVMNSEGGPAGDPIKVAVDANPRQESRGRAIINDVESVMRFYAGLVGEAPYPSLTIALIEHDLPGGHSPGYAAVLNSPPPLSQLSWRNDPSAFWSFPEFFVAHELAHQWWGQAVGWRNYHEQWLSEGFAQYFAALYARQTRGEKVFVDMLRQFRRWAIAESDEGPIWLGSRLGHLRGERRVFRALVYNKAAAVLHMLRRLMGDDHFFSGVRRFYAAQKFRKPGTDDFRAALEEETGRDLERFFERWIHGAELPHLRYRPTVETGSVSVRFEQTGTHVFDVPVTVSVIYADGRIHDTVVPVTEQRVDWTLVTNRPIKQIQVNRDYAALAFFERF